MMLNKFKFVYDSDSAVPKYRQFADALANYLSGIEYVPGTQLPNDRGLAAAYDLSVVTVGRALNLLAKRGIILRKVGAGTFIKPPREAGGKRIALVCHQKISHDGGFVTGLWNELHHQSPEYGVDLMMIQVAPEDYRKAFNIYDLDGMIILSAEEDFMPQLKELADSGLNIAQVGMWHRDFPQISFGTDHRKAAESVVDIFCKKGHRKIAFMLSHYSNTIHCGTQERLRGYQLAMYRNKLPMHPDWIIHSNYQNTAEIREQLKRLRDSGELPTAIVFEQILFTERMRHIANSLDLSIPEDISLIAFDNDMLDALDDFTLSTYTHDTAEMVSRIFDHLLKKKIHDGSPLSAKFIDRGSCKNLKTFSRKKRTNP
jgi:LacI family transcriptional regulator